MDPDSVNVGSLEFQVSQPAKYLILHSYFSFWLRRDWSGMSAGYGLAIAMVGSQRRKTAAHGGSRRQASLWPFFGPSDVEHCGGVGVASSRRKSGEPPLLPPFVRHGKRDEPRRRQLDGLSGGQDCANDVGRDTRRETHGDRQIIAPHAGPRRHGHDAVIAAYEEHVTSYSYAKAGRRAACGGD